MEEQMITGNLEINPSTKVNDLLDAYPEIEATLIGIAPPFKKLKNKFLRKSVAKAATLKHISSVGNVPLNELINKLREAAGQSKTNDSYKDENYFSDRPEWFSATPKDQNRMNLGMNIYPQPTSGLYHGRRWTNHIKIKR
jgi:hypothetical protein